MDTKLKRGSGRWLITLIVLCLIVSTSVFMVSAYPKIGELINKDTSNALEQREFISDIYQSNEALYYMLKNSQDKSLKPEDVFLEVNPSSQISNEDIELSGELINDNINYYMDILNTELFNLDYYAYDKDSKNSLQRGTKDLNTLLEENAAHESVENAYDFFVVMDYDANGQLHISKVKGLSDTFFHNEIMTSHWDRKSEYSDLGNYQAIKNTVYVYGVQKGVNNAPESYHDRIGYYFQSADEIAVVKSIDSFLIIAIVFIALAAFVIPYKKEKNIVGFSRFKHIYFEFHVIFISVFTALAYITISTIVTDSISGQITWFLGMDLSDLNLTSPIIFGLNIVFWFMCFGVTFLYIVLIKYIFNKGILKYFKEDTCIGIIFFSIKNYFKRTIEQLLTIDLKDDVNNKILQLLGINLIILTLMSSLWFFGAILAVFYSVLLFKKFKQYYTKINGNYSELLHITGEMAKGNLDVVIPKDLGVFNSVKEDLNGIHIGFKKAVEEEVKSERMKTDLVTNVSHDLKTPLTSIITYVDLLKNEEVTKSDLELYLDIIDKKSQRLQSLIEDIFEMSKISSGNVNLNIVDVEINSLIKQILLEYSMKIEEKNLIVKLNMPEEKVVIPLDSLRTFRIFENLVVNICKYTMPMSRVYIDVIDQEDKVKIILKNISAEEIEFNIEQITERFVMGDQARNTDGSGLGLAIAKSFVELQGGVFSIEVDGDLFKVIIIFNK